MALEATLLLDGKFYDVRKLEYEIKKLCDNNNKPSSNARSGEIYFTILSPMDGNLVFHEWVTSIADVKSGEFILPLTHGIKHVEKVMSFENAHCTKLKEVYSVAGKSQMYMEISIYAAILKFSDTVVYRSKELPE